MYKRYNIIKNKLIAKNTYESEWIQFSEQSSKQDSDWCTEFIDAFVGVLHYNCHCDFLQKIADGLKFQLSSNDVGDRVSWVFSLNIEYGSQEQFIWMMLVQLFGDYGTSPRSGWIEKVEDCLNFVEALIMVLCEDEEDE